LIAMAERSIDACDASVDLKDAIHFGNGRADHCNP